MTHNADSVREHKARWFVYAWDGQGNRERLPHTSTMRGTWGWDVECSCGWASKTGGATRRSVEDDLRFHRWVAAHIDSSGSNS